MPAWRSADQLFPQKVLFWFPSLFISLECRLYLKEPIFLSLKTSTWIEKNPNKIRMLQKKGLRIKSTYLVFNNTARERCENIETLKTFINLTRYLSGGEWYVIFYGLLFLKGQKTRPNIIHEIFKHPISCLWYNKCKKYVIETFAHRTRRIS